MIRVPKLIFVFLIAGIFFGCKGKNKHEKSPMQHIDAAAINRPTNNSIDSLNEDNAKLDTAKVNLKSESLIYSDKIIADLIDFSRQPLKECFFDHNRFNSAVFFRASSFTDYFYFDNAAFKGEADFTGAHFIINPKIKPGEDTIQFKKVVFCADALFEQSDIQRPISFESCYFGVKSKFSNAKFKQWASFNDCRFYKESNFISAQFNKQIAFLHNHFYGNANYIAAQFKDKCDFRFSTFDKQLSFDTLRNGSNVDTLSYTHFSNDAIFSNAVFADTVKFDKASFSSAINFANARFGPFASFKNIALKANASFDFTNTVLPDTLDFSAISPISKEVDFSVANFQDATMFSADGNHTYKKRAIFLNKSDISKLHLDYEHFVLIFNNDSKQSNVTDEKEAVYEALLKNFNDRGQKESYKELDIEYKDFKWGTKSSFVSWFGFFDKWWWNYGYNKEWVFIWTLGFIFIFSIINSIFLANLNEKMYHLEYIKTYSLKREDKLKTLKAIFSRFGMSIIYTCSIFFPLSLKRENIVSPAKWGTVYVGIVFLTGALCVAYIINFIIAK